MILYGEDIGPMYRDVESAINSDGSLPKRLPIMLSIILSTIFCIYYILRWRVLWLCWYFTSTVGKTVVDSLPYNA